MAVRFLGKAESSPFLSSHISSHKLPSVYDRQALLQHVLGHVDHMWLECTMNKGSKVKAGWLTILQTEQLLMHPRNVNNVAKIRASLNALANQKETKTKHAEYGRKRMREDEQCVQGLVACMRKLDSYPFDPASPTLRTLQSAMPASDEHAADSNSA